MSTTGEPPAGTGEQPKKIDLPPHIKFGEIHDSNFSITKWDPASQLLQGHEHSSHAQFTYDSDIDYIFPTQTDLLFKDIKTSELPAETFVARREIVTRNKYGLLDEVHTAIELRPFGQLETYSFSIHSTKSQLETDIQFSARPEEQEGGFVDALPSVIYNRDGALEYIGLYDFPLENDTVHVTTTYFPPQYDPDWYQSIVNITKPIPGDPDLGSTEVRDDAERERIEDLYNSLVVQKAFEITDRQTGEARPFASLSYPYKGKIYTLQAPLKIDFEKISAAISAPTQIVNGRISPDSWPSIMKKMGISFGFITLPNTSEQPSEEKTE